jgi:hypothetical protein
MNAGLNQDGTPIQYTDPTTGQPINISPQARLIATYRLPAPQARQLYATSSRGMVNQVLAVNPNFDIAKYEERQKTYREMSPGGPIGQQALALNTLVRHSDELMDAIDKLDNTTFTPANAGWQRIRQLLGSSAPTNFDALKTYVTGETVKLVRGGGGTEKDEENVSANINKANSPQQLVDAMKTNFAVAGGKMQALNQSIQTATGDADINVLDQGAQEIMRKRGYDPKTFKPIAPGGQQPQTKYKRIFQGPNNHQVGTNDNQNFFDLQTGQKLTIYDDGKGNVSFLPSR